MSEPEHSELVTTLHELYEDRRYDIMPSVRGALISAANCIDEVTAERDQLQERVKELEFQKVFEQQFADKLKEFGTVDRLIEEYSAAKMARRDAEATIAEKDIQIHLLSARLAELDTQHPEYGRTLEAARTLIDVLKVQLAEKDRQIEIAQSDANDWKQGMAGQEDRANDLEAKLKQAEAALKIAVEAMNSLNLEPAIRDLTTLLRLLLSPDQITVQLRGLMSRQVAIEDALAAIAEAQKERP